jgi:hypothetical protein
MALTQTISVAPGNPSARPAEVVWVDHSVPAATNFYYRLTARDRDGNESDPSLPFMVRAYREGKPSAPYSLEATRLSQGGASFVQLTWEVVEPLSILVQRRLPGAAVWSNLSGWLPSTTVAFQDATAVEALAYQYRVKGRDGSGRQSTESESLFVPGNP